MPAAVAGHSYGEYVALCVAGAFSEKELFRLSAERGRIVYDSTHAAPGAMAAVMADGPTVVQAIESLGLDVRPANLNSPEQTIIAGPIAGVETAVQKLSAAGLRIKKIPVGGAFHTPAMAEAARQLGHCLEAIEFAPPRIPVWSNTTATPYQADAATGARVARASSSYSGFV